MTDTAIHIAAIHIADLSVRYGRTTAVDGVALSVTRGAVYALVGRNGAGKSSLVRCLLGQQKPQRGHVTLFGEDVWSRRSALMQRIGVVTEDGDAPPEMSVAAIARFCARLYDKWDQASVETRLRTFGVPLTSRFGSLSKGQKKQVSLALALATAPELLVLDDPTLGLDVVARKSLFEEVIGDLADRGTTILITTHDLTGVETFADRVGMMENGRLVLDEEVDALKSRFRRIRFAARPVALDTSVLRPTAMRAWGGGAEAIVSNYDDIAFERMRSTSDIGAAEVEAMSLEDIFIAIASGNNGRNV
jgi:ABC-2 type transport system ATP-binding protein